MRQIICVHVGEKYPDDYVQKLYAGCKRNSTVDFIFTVISDRSNYEIIDDRFKIIPAIKDSDCRSDRLWWHKMEAFDPDIATDENLLIDVDVVLTNSIDKLWDHLPGEFLICQDFNRQWYPYYARSNSSVVRFTKHHCNHIHPLWCKTKTDSIRNLRGDQDWMDEHLSFMKKWPKEWIMSWKWEVYLGGMITSDQSRYRRDTTTLDRNTCILAFHGKPDPHEVKDDLIERFWRK